MEANGLLRNLPAPTNHPVATIYQISEATGVCVKRVVECIHEKAPTPPRQFLYDVELVVRDST